MGGNGKVEGRACPAPTGWREWVAHERGKGGRQAGPFAVGGGVTGNGWRRKARRNPSGLASSASSPVRGAFCAGGAREGSLPCQREVPSASEAEGFPAVCGCNGQSGKARRNPPVR